MEAKNPEPQSDANITMFRSRCLTFWKCNTDDAERASGVGSRGSATDKQHAIDVDPEFKGGEAKNKKEAKLLFIKSVHQAIVSKFNSFAVVFTLLAGVDFVAILQPPGTFDGRGKIRPPVLIGCFLFFSTLSFLLACTGLLVVVAGTASMFRPGFYLNVDLTFQKDSTGEKDRGSVPEVPQKGQPTSTKKDSIELDDPKVLASLVLTNLHRAWRLRVYLVCSTVLCVVAYVCGAFAILDWAEKRNGWFLVVAVAVGGVAMAVEVAKSGSGLTSFYSGRWRRTFREVPMLPIRHPHSQCVSRMLRKVCDSPGRATRSQPEAGGVGLSPMEAKRLSSNLKPNSNL